MQKLKVLLGMSGGTDSSVAAILLQELGYEVVGVTFRLWSETDNQDIHNEPTYIQDARQLAANLKIEHYVIDLKSFFYDNIIQYFKEEYLAGRTPNPCAKCNVILKWHFLNQQAEKLNCEFIATGHYANIEQWNSTYYISKGLDPEKEQSFFLWGLKQEILRKMLLPLGNLTKQEVREIAKDRGFQAVAHKKESIGVCFIENGDYQPFLSKLLQSNKLLPGKGNFVDKNGKVLGEHSGYPFYTVGQRRGLGLSPNEPWYITQIKCESNTLVLGKRNDLYQSTMLVKDYVFQDINDADKELITRIRYRKQAALSRIEIINENLLKVYFNDKEWSIAPGQTAAFYIENRLVGGGFIVA